MSHQIQCSSKITNRQLCDRLALPYGTLVRWRRRVKNGLPLLAQPGPRKLGALPFEELRREAALLPHGTKRSAGSGALYTKYSHAISRRDLGQLITRERKSLGEARRRNWKRISWKEPNLAWAIDATEYERDQQGRKLYVIAIQDLASRYCFEPLVTLNAGGQDIADHLRKLFERHGPPLFLKRDNGSAFNNQIVDELIATQCVIPLNSPAYYPRYNGAIEKGIRELKEQLKACLPSKPKAWNPKAVASFACAVAHVRNCRPRRSLCGHSATENYYHQTRSRFGKRKRHTVFEWIRSRSNATVQQMERADHRSLHAAWRQAAETWLRCQGLITLSINNKVLPHLPLELLS